MATQCRDTADHNPIGDGTKYGTYVTENKSFQVGKTKPAAAIRFRRARGLYSLFLQRGGAPAAAKETVGDVGLSMGVGALCGKIVTNCRGARLQHGDGDSSSYNRNNWENVM